MKNHFLRFVCALAFISAAVAARAQARPAAERLIHFQIGGGYSLASPDYGTKHIQGMTIYGDALLYKRLGIEADVHLTNIITPADIGESSYLVGPVFTAYHHNRFNVYVKGLGGYGRFSYEKGYYPVAQAYTSSVFSVGGGLDIRASNHFTVRAVDFEQQFWPNFGDHGLTPYVMTFGGAYTF